MISTISYYFGRVIAFFVRLFGFADRRIPAADADAVDAVDAVDDGRDPLAHPRGFVHVLRGPKGFIPPNKIGFIRELMDAYNKAAQRSVSRILDNIEKFRIKIERSRFGYGIFHRGNGIPRNTRVGFYDGEMATSRYTNDHEKGAAYAFNFDEFAGIKFSIIGSQQHWNGNGSFFNHSCFPNCAAECKQLGFFVKKPLCLIVITALRNIEPGEELTIDYNEGHVETGSHSRNTGLETYWRPLSDFEHAPEWSFTRCACQVDKKGKPFCPKQRAFWNYMTKEENTRCSKETRENRGKALRKANLAAKRAASKRSLSESPEAPPAKRRRQ